MTPLDYGRQQRRTVASVRAAVYVVKLRQIPGRQGEHPVLPARRVERPGLRFQAVEDASAHGTKAQGLVEPLGFARRLEADYSC